MFNTVQKLNSKILVTWGGWDRVTSFGAKIGLSSITLQPLTRFSQTNPHFVWRVVGTSFKLNDLENLGLLGVWNLT